MDDRERFRPESLAHWRTWLGEHHARPAGVWLVTWKAAAPGLTVRYEEAVEQALCFGWVDGQAQGLDAERTMLWFAPRRPRSLWSRSNKQRVARLSEAGLMAPAGLAAIEAARANGCWTLLDDVEDLIVPDDLAAALDARPGARAHWDGFPRSPRRAMLLWLVEARRPETRAKRVTDIADKAAAGERARG